MERTKDHPLMQLDSVINEISFLCTTFFAVQTYIDRYNEKLGEALVMPAKSLHDLTDEARRECDQLFDLWQKTEIWHG